MNRRGSWVTLILLLLDVTGLYLSIAVAQAARLNAWGRDLNFSLAMVIAITLLVFYVLNLYSLDRMSRTVDTMLRTLLAVAIASLITAAIIYSTRSFEVDPVLWRSVFLVSMLSFLIWSTIFRMLMIRWIRSNRRSRWLFVGDDHDYQELYSELQQIDPSVLLYDMHGNSPEDFYRVAVDLGNEQSLDGVIVHEMLLGEKYIPELMQLRLSGCRVLGAEEFYEEFAMKIPVAYLKDHWFVLSEGFSLLHHSTQLRVKRVFDLVIAIVGLLVFLPLLVISAPLIKLDGGSVYYRQRRTGKDGESFELVKLRTMVQNAEQGGARWAEQNDPRITPIGRWLRKTRIDELPQLWNVMKGDMSFVGPRPERPAFNGQLEKEIPYYNLRHMIKPGITGWAQVMYPYGASTTDALKKLEYDLYYIKNYSLVLDIFIVLRTLRVVVSHAGR